MAVVLLKRFFISGTYPLTIMLLLSLCKCSTQYYVVISILLFCCFAGGGGGGGGGGGISLRNYKIYLNSGLQYKNNKQENCALLVITCRMVVTSCRRFGTTYRFRLSRNVGRQLPPPAAS